MHALLVLLILAPPMGPQDAKPKSPPEKISTPLTDVAKEQPFGDNTLELLSKLTTASTTAFAAAAEEHRQVLSSIQVSVKTLAARAEMVSIKTDLTKKYLKLLSGYTDVLSHYNPKTTSNELLATIDKDLLCKVGVGTQVGPIVTPVSQRSMAAALNAELNVRVTTRLNNFVANDLTVYCNPLAWKDDKEPWHSFPQPSSPTSCKMPAGLYYMWATNADGDILLGATVQVNIPAKEGEAIDITLATKPKTP